MRACGNLPADKKNKGNDVENELTADYDGTQRDKVFGARFFAALASFAIGGAAAYAWFANGHYVAGTVSAVFAVAVAFVAASHGSAAMSPSVVERRASIDFDDLREFVIENTTYRDARQRVAMALLHRAYEFYSEVRGRHVLDDADLTAAELVQVVRRMPRPD